MEIGKPNENGVIDEGFQEVVASHGRATAAINLALCEDGLYRVSADMHYSYGGFSGPISINAQGYATQGEARVAGLEELLRRWHTAPPSFPDSVHDELRILREQIESHLRQPSLF